MCCRIDRVKNCGLTVVKYMGNKGVLTNQRQNVRPFLIILSVFLYSLCRAVSICYQKKIIRILIRINKFSLLMISIDFRTALPFNSRRTLCVIKNIYTGNFFNTSFIQTVQAKFWEEEIPGDMKKLILSASVPVSDAIESEFDIPRICG